MAKHNVDDYAHHITEQERSQRDAQNHAAFAERRAHERDVRAFAGLPVREHPHQEVDHNSSTDASGHWPSSLFGSQADRP